MRRGFLCFNIANVIILLIVGVAVALWIEANSWKQALAFWGSAASILGVSAVAGGVLAWRSSRHLREPDLVIEAARDDCNNQFLQIKVTNRSVKCLGWWDKFLLDLIGRDERPVAEQCTFTVDVCGPRVKIKGMPGRWNESPEPFVPPSLPLPHQPLLGRKQFDRTIWGVPSLAHAVVRTPLDLLPGGKEECAGIFIKHDGDPNCYGFNTGSYFWPGYRYEEYEIGHGRFDVTVRVRSGSYSRSERFILTNKGTTYRRPCDFNLKLKCPNT